MMDYINNLLWSNNQVFENPNIDLMINNDEDVKNEPENNSNKGFENPNIDLMINNDEDVKNEPENNSNEVSVVDNDEEISNEQPNLFIIKEKLNKSTSFWVGW